MREYNEKLFFDNEDMEGSLESRFSSPPAGGGVAAASADEVVGGRLILFLFCRLTF
jgi:hypothetical protein